MSAPDFAHLYVQRKRTRGWRMPEGAINCTRPTDWGNPFRVGEAIALPRADHEDPPHWLEVEVDPVLAVELYRSWLHQNGFVGQMRSELRGRVLACWCAPGDPCHVQDVLLPLANGDDG